MISRAETWNGRPRMASLASLLSLPRRHPGALGLLISWPPCGSILTAGKPRCWGGVGGRPDGQGGGELGPETVWLEAGPARKAGEDARTSSLGARKGVAFSPLTWG